MRLSSANAALLPSEVTRPAYDRAVQERGIVHFGLGAFTRAHQAVFTDASMTGGDRDWTITGVSLRSPTVAEQLNPQDGLYLVAEQSGVGTHYRLGAAIREVLVAPREPSKVIAALADPATRIVSFTVTEKGYCRAADGSLDPAAVADGSFYPLLAEAMRQRGGTGAGGLTLLSCDNLAGNGAVLERLMRDYLAANAPDLLAWFNAHCTCPSTMVDRIVPATTDADRAAAEASTGLRDEALVVTEPFSQWVIEDRFANGRPQWEGAGAELVGDVGPYETAKLRMLNGAHSLLAYCGLEAGYSHVHEAITDSGLRAMVDALIAEAIPTIDIAPGQDLKAYATRLVERFANPALNHRLSQIAMDGSQKISQRWLETLAAHQHQNGSCPAVLRGIAAWIGHLRGRNGPVDDPLAARLAAAAGEPDPVNALFGSGGILASQWHPSRGDIAEISRHIG